jgi:hypothetical protein
VCGSDTGCGGDLVGSHTFEDICLEGETTFPAGIENCPSATVSIMDPTVSGSVTLMEDGTYNIQNTFATVTTVVLPAECLGGQEPAAICATIEMDLDDGSCEVVDGGCSCTQASVEQSDESGTWSVEGNLLTTTPEGDDAEPDTLEFCVQGDTAIIKPVDTDGEEPFEVSFIMRRQ